MPILRVERLHNHHPRTWELQLLQPRCSCLGRSWIILWKYIHGGYCYVLCMTGCSACTYGGFAAAMAPLSVGIYCTSCNAGYAYNYVQGNCSLCPANCLSCQCNGDTCYEMMCLTCASGYTVGGISANFTCVASSTSALEGGDEAGSTFSGVNIVLAVWGAIVTVIAGVFIALFMKNRSKSNSVGMLNAELKEVRVSF